MPCAASLTLRHPGQPGARIAPAVRKHCAQRFGATRADNHVLRDRQVKEIPLRAACSTLLSAKRNLQERNFPLIALRSELLAQHRAYEFKSLCLASNAKKIDLLCRVHRR